jgi:hypothetical protein
MNSITQLKQNIETLKQEIRYARQEQSSESELELLYNALEDLQLELYKASSVGALK